MNLGMGIVVKRSLTRNDWRRILSLQSRFPELKPTHYGAFEPLRKKFDPNRVAEAVNECWDATPALPNLIWESRQTLLGGRLFTRFSPMPEYSSVPLWNIGQTLPKDLEFTSAFAEEISKEFDCMFGFVHLLGEQEIAHLGQQAARAVVQLSAAKQKYNIGVTPMILRLWVPDLFWATIFGPPYVNLFSRDRLLSAPAAVVREIAPSLVYMQLTESIWDCTERFSRVDSIRARVKEHLGVDAFWRNNAAAEHKYVVPEEFKEW